MVRRVILGLIFAGIVALVYVGYKNWTFKRAMLSGEVSGGRAGTATPESSSVLPIIESTVAPQKTTPSVQADPDSPRPTDPVPSGDTISPAPPNGTVFAGTGHFQVYRQGNLTWRINTDTGQTCILFATNEEWRKPRVYQHGCGSTAAITR